MTKHLLKLLSEKPYHADHQERARLVREWKQDIIKLQQKGSTKI
jgi:hypothetical protein